MRVNNCLAILLLLSPSFAIANEVEVEPTLELIEFLGESDDETDLEIAMTNIEGQSNLKKLNIKEVNSLEVNEDESF